VKLSQHGVELIARFEGFSAKPYRDAVGVWTIGFGSTKGVGPKTPAVTRAQAIARLKRDVDETYGQAVNALGLPLNQNQFDALTSFVYNLGPGVLDKSTGVGRALRAHKWDLAADQMLRWDKAGGLTLLGLTRRRQAERALFLQGAAPSKLERWRDELAERRGQLEDETRPGTRRFLIRRIGELRSAINREKARG
jgi:lysozyme